MIQNKHIFASLILVYIFSSPIFFINLAYAETPTAQVGSNPATPAPATDPPGMYSYIAPLGSSFTGTIDLRDDKTLTTYLKNWLQFAVGLAGVFGVVRLVIVGFTIITSAANIDAKEKIRKELAGIIGSLLLIAGSWIFLNTINPQLVTQNLLIPLSTGVGQMREICTEADKSNCADLTPRDRSGNPVGTDGRGNILLADNVTKGLERGDGYYFLVTDKKSGVKYWYGPHKLKSMCLDKAAVIQSDDTAEMSVDLLQGADAPNCIDYRTDIPAAFKATEDTGRARLWGSDPKKPLVNVNNPPCTNPLVGKGCTNLTGLADNVYANLTGLAESCKNTIGKDCGITLTGGTEAGHSTHGRTYNYTFDMSSTPEVTAFLKKNATIAAPSFSKVEPNIRYYYLGWWYTYEGMGGTKTGSGNHYHVCMANAEGHMESQIWSCNDEYLLKNGVVVTTKKEGGISTPMNMDQCPTNKDNPNQKLCLGIEIPN